MDAEQIIALDYSAQHFGLHPRQFVDYMYNVCLENINAALSTLKDYLSDEFGDVVPAYQFLFGIDALLRDLTISWDKAIDKLEVYLNRNVFSIPSNVVLPEDRVHLKFHCTKEMDDEIDAEIEELKYKIVKEKHEQAKLKAKIEEQGSVKGHLLHIKQNLALLLEIADEQQLSVNSLKTTLSKCVELMELKKNC